MPVGIQDWRIGIAESVRFTYAAQFSSFPLKKLLPRVFGLYVKCDCFILLSLISMPASILYLMVQSLPDLLVLANQIAGKEMVFSSGLVHTFAPVHVNIQVILYFLVSCLLTLTHISILFVFRSITYIHHIIMNDTHKWLHSVLTSMVTTCYLDLYNVIWFPWFNILLLRSGNIHPNPSPVTNQFNFCNWNLNGLMVHDKLKITLIGTYIAVYHYDVSSFQKHSWTVKLMTLIIVYKALYYREITSYQIKNLEILNEAIVCKISIKR